MGEVTGDPSQSRLLHLHTWHAAHAKLEGIELVTSMEGTPMTSTSRSARLAKWLSVPLGLVISALLIWQASYAAFSDKTTTAGTLGAGTVSITEGTNHLGQFTADNLAPGAPAETVRMHASYDGTLTADIIFYGDDFSETVPDFAEQIELTLTAIPFGTGTSDGETHEFFTGTLAGFASHDGFRSPLPVSKGYGAEVLIEYRLKADAPDTFQGARAYINFVGEATSRPNDG